MRGWIGRPFVVLMGLLALPAMAQDQPPKKTSQDELPLGLGKLRWGMTVQEARGIYPTLKGASAGAGASVSSQSLEGYSYDGCGYGVGLTFAGDKLVSVALDAKPGPGVTRCAVLVREDFETRYSNTPNHIYFPQPAMTDHFQEMWDGPNTAVEINTLPPNGALGIRFKDANWHG